MKIIFSRHLFTGISLFLLMLGLALIPMSAFAATPAATSHANTPDFAAIDAYVLSQMSQLHVPGVALGIVHGNQVVHLRGFGVAGPDGRSVTPQTTGRNPFDRTENEVNFSKIVYTGNRQGEERLWRQVNNLFY